MIKINEKEIIKYYKQLKKDRRLIKTLLQDNWYRYKWCKKRNLPLLLDQELEKDLKKCEDEIAFINRFVER